MTRLLALAALLLSGAARAVTLPPTTWQQALDAWVLKYPASVLIGSVNSSTLKAVAVDSSGRLIVSMGPAVAGASTYIVPVYPTWTITGTVAFSNTQPGETPTRPAYVTFSNTLPGTTPSVPNWVTFSNTLPGTSPTFPDWVTFSNTLPGTTPSNPNWVTFSNTLPGTAANVPSFTSSSPYANTVGSDTCTPYAVSIGNSGGATLSIASDTVEFEIDLDRSLSATLWLGYSPDNMTAAANKSGLWFDQGKPIIVTGLDLTKVGGMTVYLAVVPGVIPGGTLQAILCQRKRRT